MNLVALFPEAGARPELFTAKSGEHEAHGPTAGDALNSLMAQLDDPNEARMVLVRPKRGDQYFSEEQTRRLVELTAARRAARDDGTEFPADQLAELNGLIEAELEGRINRSKEFLRLSKS
jgi:hypothetical protein